MSTIREATNEAGVLGSERFKTKMAKKLNLPVTSAGHGGDRKSEADHQGDQRV